MAAPKTLRNDGDVEAFLSAVTDARRRDDAREVVAMMREITGEEPAMWGSSIVGFGTLRYRTKSGQEADWMVTGLSPRKQALTVYLMDGFDRRADLLDRLGPHTTGRSCLYLKRLDVVDHDVLRELIRSSFEQVRAWDAGAQSAQLTTRVEMG